MDESALVELAQLLADAQGISLSRLGYLAVDDGKFFSRIGERGGRCTLRTARVVIEFVDERWPPDKEWPSGIPRPPPRPDG